MISTTGFAAGTLYASHVSKIRTNGEGYLAKHGTLLHYAKGSNFSQGKVRDRKAWTGTNNWSPRDIRQFDSIE